MQGIPPNISTSSEAAPPTQTIVSTSTSNTSPDSAQEMIRAIAQSTVTILNNRISETDGTSSGTSREELIGTRTSLEHILSSDDSISSTHSSFILEVFNESRDSNTLLGVAGVIACLYFKLQTLADTSADPDKETITDNDFIEFIRNSQNALETFHSNVRPDDLPDDLKIYHLKIRNIDTLLAWWLRKPYPIGKEYRIMQFVQFESKDMRCRYSLKGLLQQHLDVVYMDEEFRSLEAENSRDHADAADDDNSSLIENPGSLALSDADLNDYHDDMSSVDTMEHMSGKI